MKRSLLQELLTGLREMKASEVHTIKLDDPGQDFRAWEDNEQESMDTTRLQVLLDSGTETLTKVLNDKRLKLPIEFGDVQDVIDNGSTKHGRDSWLEPGVFQFDKRSQSELRHLMKKTGLWYDPDHDKAIKQLLDAMEGLKYNDMLGTDTESGLSHDLHSACNSLMFYTVKKRGILKPE